MIYDEENFDLCNDGFTDINAYVNNDELDYFRIDGNQYYDICDDEDDNGDDPYSYEDEDDNYYDTLI